MTILLKAEHLHIDRGELEDLLRYEHLSASLYLVPLNKLGSSAVHVSTARALPRVRRNRKSWCPICRRDHEMILKLIAGVRETIFLSLVDDVH